MNTKFLNNFLLFVIIICFISCNNLNKTERDIQENIQETDIIDANIDSNPFVLDKFDTIKLLTPQKKYGKSLMECIWERKSNRSFSITMLSLQQLSDLMWVTYGINRLNDSTRNLTVPSAMALYPLEVYAVLSNGIYSYDIENHLLIPYMKGDFHETTGEQPFVKNAPLNIVIFADFEKYDEKYDQMTDERKLYLASLDAAHCCQNIYLYCASEGLNTVERAMAPSNICEIFKLSDKHLFIIAQTVGLPE